MTYLSVKLTFKDQKKVTNINIKTFQLEKISDSEMGLLIHAKLFSLRLKKSITLHRRKGIHSFP